VPGPHATIAGGGTVPDDSMVYLHGLPRKPFRDVQETE